MSQAEVRNDEFMISVRGMPSSWPHCKVWLQGAVEVLERDSDEHRKRIETHGEYGLRERLKNVKGFAKVVRTLFNPT